MKKLFLSLVMAAAIALLSVNPVWAADLANGAKIFSANCASCHAGGKNLVNPQKTLAKADLEKYDMYDLDKIKTQVTNGKAAMPSFKGRLSATEIDDVANYVLGSSDKGWVK
jgi:cytochrome c6